MIYNFTASCENVSNQICLLVFNIILERNLNLNSYICKDGELNPQPFGLQDKQYI